MKIEKRVPLWSDFIEFGLHFARSWNRDDGKLLGRVKLLERVRLLERVKLFRVRWCICPRIY